MLTLLYRSSVLVTCLWFFLLAFLNCVFIPLALFLPLFNALYYIFSQIYSPWGAMKFLFPFFFLVDIILFFNFFPELGFFAFHMLLIFVPFCSKFLNFCFKEYFISTNAHLQMSNSGQGIIVPFCFVILFWGKKKRFLMS